MDARKAVAKYLQLPRVKTLQDRSKLWNVSVALSVTGFGMYALYQQDRISEFVGTLRNALKTGRNAFDVMHKLSEISGTLVTELHEYLLDGQDKVPVTFSRTTELMTTQQFRRSMRLLVMTFFEGMALSGGDDPRLRSPDVLGHLIERVIERATQRPDLLSVAVRLATRNAADAMLETLNDLRTPPNGATSSHTSPNTIDLALSAMATPNGRRVMSSIVTAFTSTLATVAMEKMRGVDTWDEVFRVISRPNNLRFVYQLMGVQTREFVRALANTLTERRVRSTAQSSACSEITPEVDYSGPPLPPAPASLCRVRSEPTFQHVTLETVHSLTQTFATVAQDRQHRQEFYSFCGRIVGHIFKIVLSDVLEWVQRAISSDSVLKLGILLFEFLVFLAVPLIYVFTTNLSMEAYKM